MAYNSGQEQEKRINCYETIYSGELSSNVPLPTQSCIFVEICVLYFTFSTCGSKTTFNRGKRRIKIKRDVYSHACLVNFVRDSRPHYRAELIPDGVILSGNWSRRGFFN